MEDFGFNSSPESLLIPQETLDSLWNLVNPGGNGQFFNEMSQEISAPVQVQSSLPAISDWPGDYGFNVSFGQTDVSKNIEWIFRETERKLYVKRDVPCHVNFSVSVPILLPGASIRAMAVYTSPQNANESVHRCLNHSMREIEAQIFEAEHLIRSECVGAHYVEHKESKRHSVIVPFENPPDGECFSTYVYKFACLGSCIGGPNRRPLTLVFTLEHNNFVIGRRSINLKVCANPGRDSGVTKKTNAPVAKIKIEPQKATVPKRKIKEYAVETSDWDCYVFLKRMKKMYLVTKSINSSSESEFSSLEQ